MHCFETTTGHSSFEFQKQAGNQVLPQPQLQANVLAELPQSKQSAK